MKKLQSLIEKATSSFHTVQAATEVLLANGFEELSFGDVWQLEKGKKYIVNVYGTTMIAFSIGKEFSGKEGFRIGAAHGDFPGFRIKPNPQMEKEGYTLLNTEVYGGVNLQSWLDRGLSIAGRVALKSEDVFHPELRLVDLKELLITIPNIAIHLERDMNKGVELKKQTHMLPIIGMEGDFIEYLATYLQVDKEDILDYELQIYNADKPQVCGLNGEFLSAPRLDDLTAVQALLDGMLLSDRKDGLNIIAIFDNEEVGSDTKQGAASLVFSHILEKIYVSLGMGESAYRDALFNSMMLSVDVSQGYHPSYGGKYDPTNHSILNGGFSIKEASSQRYATDSEAVGIVVQICEKEGIPYQRFVNHSDVPGGSTLGAIASTYIPVKTVDIGVPLLSMHSAKEMMGVKDQESVTRLIQAYFSL